MEELTQDQAYRKDLPKLQGQWEKDLMARRLRTSQICQQRIVEMTANGTYPTEAMKKAMAAEEARKAEAEKAKKAGKFGAHDSPPLRAASAAVIPVHKIILTKKSPDRKQRSGHGIKAASHFSENIIHRTAASFKSCPPVHPLIELSCIRTSTRKSFGGTA